MDHGIAMTELDLERAKEEVILSLIPLFLFILSILYAFCRLGIFSVCNPLKVCPQASDTQIDMPSLTPKKLFDYKKGLIAKKSEALASFQQPQQQPHQQPPNSSSMTNVVAVELTSPSPPDQQNRANIPATIEEEGENYVTR